MFCSFVCTYIANESHALDGVHFTSLRSHHRCNLLLELPDCIFMTASFSAG